MCSLLDAPEFTSGRDIVNTSVVAGNDITLSCIATANPPVNNISLSYDLANGSPNNIDTSSGTSFVITSASTNNQGLYICTATNPVAITELMYNLIIGGKLLIKHLVIKNGLTYFVLFPSSSRC